MTAYLNKIGDVWKLDLNAFLVIDRFKWQETGAALDVIIDAVCKDDENGYYQYLSSFMKTELQQRNLNLVWKASYLTLRDACKKQGLY